MKIIEASQPMTDEQRSQKLFAGELIIFRQIPAMLSLCDYVDRFMTQALDGVAPEQAQQHLSAEHYLAFVNGVQQRFQTDDEARALFFNALQQTGVELTNTYYDYFPMRVVSAQQQFTRGLRTAVGHHRDTWGGNVQAQCNWWAPIYDLVAERTMAFYPEYWDKPTRNTTADWDFEKYLAARHEPSGQNSVSYPAAPQLLQAIDEEQAVKVVIDAGDMLCFSSAHLHATVPNTTNLTRYSVEMRTINSADLKAGRGAPNVDNAASKPRYNWYRHALDGTSLSQLMG